MSDSSSTPSDSPTDSASQTLDDVSQTSSLQSTSDQNSIRKVYFPEEETDLVTGYLEPPDPWQYAQHITREELISRYKSSCRHHGSEPLARVLQQLKEMDVEGGEGCWEVLNLKGEQLRHHHCEPLEEILKRLHFHTINLEECFQEDEASVAIFDMVEYYEAAKQLNISSNNSIGLRGWQACSQMLKKTRCLEKLVARNTQLSEQLMPTLCRGLRIGTNLQILHLENCSLSGRPVAILVNALKTNTSLKELHLADNGLGVADALHIRDLLRVNSTLQLLDVSNNSMQDKGVGHICDGLVDQALQHGQYSNLMKDLSGMCHTSGESSGPGLSVLILWNNQLTKNSAFSFYKLIANSKTLDTLNVGHNTLTSESLLQMKEAVQQSRSLERLGLQSTCMTCEGAIALAECIAVNSQLQRIDLRDNPIQIGGLLALARSMKAYTGVTRLDLDDKPKRKLDGGAEAVQQFCDLVREIREYSVRNAQVAPSSRDGRGVAKGEAGVREPPAPCVMSMSSNSRKISLTCETLMRSSGGGDPSREERKGGNCLEPRRGMRLRSPAPSPVPSPSPSPHSSPLPSPSRFHVSKVPEGASSSSFLLLSSPSSSLPDSPSPSSSHRSRFKVTLVSEPTVSLGTPPSTPPLPPTVVTSSTSNVTIGFTFDEAPKMDDGSSGDERGGTTGLVATEGEGGNAAEERASSGTRDIMPDATRQASEGSTSVEAQMPSSPEPSPFSVPGRIRKFSSIVPPLSVEAEQPKNPTNLERLLGLFQHPSSLFTKSVTNPLCAQNGGGQSSVSVGCLFGSSVARLPCTEVPQAPAPSKPFSAAFVSVQEVPTTDCQNTFPSSSRLDPMASHSPPRQPPAVPPQGASLVQGGEGGRTLQEASGGEDGQHSSGALLAQGGDLLGCSSCCRYPDPNCNTYDGSGGDVVDNMEAVKKWSSEQQCKVVWGGGGVGGESGRLPEEGGGEEEEEVCASTADVSRPPLHSNLLAHLGGES